MARIDFYNLSSQEKLEVFQQISNLKGLSPAAVEKDWWVVHTLRMIVEMEIAPHLVFKGGTSLSKAWKLIQRFSEDIDLALDHKFLGFSSDLSVKQVKKLRKASREYIKEVFYPALNRKLQDLGCNDVQIELGDISGINPEPIGIELYYTSVTQSSTYTRPRVLLEIGSRSLREPFTVKQFTSLVGESFPDKLFADNPISIQTVNPERTFLEKIFLLHEEFQKSVDKVRVDRLSRHLYDIEKLMGTEYVEIALDNKQLYYDIINHRRTFARIGHVDYQLHQPRTLNFIPPMELIEKWKKDYQIMREEMIYGESLSFESLIEKMKGLRDRMNNLNWT